MLIEILFKMLLFKGGVLIYAEHCVYIYIHTCAGGVRFSNSNQIIPSDYRILLLLKMPVPNIYI